MIDENRESGLVKIVFNFLVAIRDLEKTRSVRFSNAAPLRRCNVVQL